MTPSGAVRRRSSTHCWPGGMCWPSCPRERGKSVCYQVPALLLPGITLVVSPLVSLMRDQVTQLADGSARRLPQQLSHLPAVSAGPDRAREGRYKIIYVAPERLDTEGFQSFVRSAQISMVAVDEAHCILPVGAGLPPRLSEHPGLCGPAAPEAGGGGLHRHRHLGGPGGYPAAAGAGGPPVHHHRV